MGELGQSEVGAGLAAIITGIASVVFLVRKKLSSDSLEIRKDKAEENIIGHLERQRDQALSEVENMRTRMDKAVQEKSEALGKVSDLTREVENLSGQVRILKELVERLGTSLDETRNLLNANIIENNRLRQENNNHE